MLTNTDCTLYHFNRTTQGYDRYYLSAVMWQESRTEKIRKQGVLISDDVNIYVPREIAVFPKCTESMDMAVKGNIDFAFDNTSQKTVSDSLKVFNGLYPDKVTVHTYEDKNYSVGSQLDHIKLIAR